ncbi:hypothetical protein E2C01_005070 [Portunus trituberculatus]|uniref:Uncharacterized protein n=1 Tax=Portunus trituberculatus TaxID=210409 RepID=A0A5B7CSD2_PORTR|nr:hypothetical protein [Portunus trituberculatus]
MLACCLMFVLPLKDSSKAIESSGSCMANGEYEITKPTASHILASTKSPPLTFCPWDNGDTPSSAPGDSAPDGDNTHAYLQQKQAH